VHSTDPAVKKIKAPRDVLRGGLWRDEALSRLDRLESLSRSVFADSTDSHAQLVVSHVDAARSLVNGRAQVREWWTGARVEATWRHMRVAEEMLFESSSGVTARAQASVTLTRGIETLGPGNPQVKELKRILGLQHPAPEDELISAGSVVLAATHALADRQYRELRQFRNGLRILNALLIVAGLCLLASVRVWGWSLLPPTDGLPSNSLVGLAMFFGSLGALFSAIPSLSQMPDRATPFSPVTEQATLKVVVGAWSAVIGLMAVAAGLGSADTSQLSGFAMVAALFGAGQEAITRFADHKAGDLRSSAAPVASAAT
jgi:hypothetical protein